MTINKVGEVAKMTELRDEERVILKNLSVRGLSITFECCFSPSNDSERMRVCRKTNLSDNPQCLAPKFSNWRSVMSWGIRWATVLLVKDDPLQKVYGKIGG